MADGDSKYLASGEREVNRIIRENSHLFSNTQCRVCSAVLISKSQKLAHYQSKKHANKVRQYLSIHKAHEPSVKKCSTSNGAEVDRHKACLVCNMIFPSLVVAESHYQGRVHAKNLCIHGFYSPAIPHVRTQNRRLMDRQNAAPLGSFAGDPDRFCAICHSSFNNPLMAKQHYVGKKHKKQLTKLKLMATYGPSTVLASTVKGYSCTVCNIELNSVEQYEAHIGGFKHKQNMKAKKIICHFSRPAEILNSEFKFRPHMQLMQQNWSICTLDYK